MVNLGSSFKETMMCLRPLLYIPSYNVISPLVLEKNIFEGVIPYMGVAAPRKKFRFPIPLRLHMKFGFDWFSGFGEEDL